MKHLAAAICLAGPALADSTLTLHHDPGPADGWFARIDVYNEPGSSTFTRTLDSEHGPVTVQYDTKAGTSAAMADSDAVMVLDLPQGIVAVPRVIQATEGQFSQIYLFKYVGA